jgi:hypothetical protein
VIDIFHLLYDLGLKNTFSALATSPAGTLLITTKRLAPVMIVDFFL